MGMEASRLFSNFEIAIFWTSACGKDKTGQIQIIQEHVCVIRNKIVIVYLVLCVTNISLSNGLVAQFIQLEVAMRS